MMNKFVKIRALGLTLVVCIGREEGGVTAQFRAHCSKVEV